ncbi:hypothetical protein BVC80_645g51 [Macleaya cordata]|uniref:Zinc finger protein n=1 Tax=Macleaya cordata TaxID=56857 RepID=A0A200QJR1_MACCD|nr:hypothetical protein BVC80_645g51 [Macleaya cordata]
MVEIFNKWIRPARHLPIFPMLEKIRVNIMELFHERRKEAFNSSSCFTKHAEKLIEKAANASTSYFVHPASESIYEVRDEKNWAGIPSRSFEQELYMFGLAKEVYRLAYENVIEPVLPKNHVGFVIGEDILPPKKRRKSGHPKIKRKRSDAIKEKRIMHCSICGGSGHTMKSCSSHVS